ncbi:MAG TPA: Wzz/FepE/Etk N-terminal domain-containing protein, partial [Candidatus Binataceae bacterium]|nr:Wzz/FepE/Etk N-terminal domain-containing protein [Candidatus Binataceae bacterium]
MAAKTRNELAPWGSGVPSDPLIRREQDPFSSRIDFKEYWRMIYKHRLAAISLALAAVAMVNVWRFIRTPEYEATSTILIQPQTPEVLKDTENFNNEQFQSTSDYDYYRTQFQLLKSASLAASVIRSNGLETNPLFNPASQHPGVIGSAVAYVTDELTSLREKLASLAGLKLKNDNFSTAGETDSVNSRVIQAYLARLTVEPVRNTRLVIVGFTTPDPELSARIANAHVQTFIRQGLDLQAQTGHNVEEFLNQKLGELKDNVEKSEAALNAYRRKAGIVTLENSEQNSQAGSNPLTQRLGELNTQLTDASSKRIALGTQHQMITRGEYASLPEVISDPVIQSLKEQVAQLSTQYAALSNRFNPGYHPLDDLQARLIASHRALDFETKRVAASV